MTATFNLTQHASTPAQRVAGVVDLEGALRDELTGLLSFKQPPSRQDMSTRAMALVEVLERAGAHAGARVMVAGAPWFMPILVERLRASSYEPVCAFSRRESVERTHDDGSVTKRSVFVHVGWVTP